LYFRLVLRTFKLLISNDCKNDKNGTMSESVYKTCTASSKIAGGSSADARLSDRNPVSGALFRNR
jgi:hypothetical protein